MLARLVSFAFVDVNLALHALVSGLTMANELVDTIFTFASIQARIGCALVNIDLAIGPHESGQTTAKVAFGILVGKCRVEFEANVTRKTENNRLVVKARVGAFKAKGIILTRVQSTFLDILFAIFALISRVAQTVVIIDAVLASGVMKARVTGAFINVDFTCGAFKSGAGAVASVRIDAILALAFVETR